MTYWRNTEGENKKKKKKTGKKKKKKKKKEKKKKKKKKKIANSIFNTILVKTLSRRIRKLENKTKSDRRKA